MSFSKSICPHCTGVNEIPTRRLNSKIKCPSCAKSYFALKGETGAKTKNEKEKDRDVKQGCLIILALLGLLTFGGVKGCGWINTRSDEERVVNPSPPPELPDFEIISDEVMDSKKRSVDVRLEGKISEDAIRLVARKIRSDVKQQYDRTFVTFYLPGQEVGAGGWATGHYNPFLKVKVLGFVEDAGSMPPRPPGQEVLGRWEYDALIRLTLVKTNTEHRMESLYFDGSAGKPEPVTVQEYDGLLLIRPKRKEGNGEYWSLNIESGTLFLLNRHDKIFGTAKAIGD